MIFTGNFIILIKRLKLVILIQFDLDFKVILGYNSLAHVDGLRMDFGHKRPLGDRSGLAIGFRLVDTGDFYTGLYGERALVELVVCGVELIGGERRMAHLLNR
jgi:hypothetical protein